MVDKKSSTSDSVPIDSVIEKTAERFGHNSWGVSKIFWGLLFVLLGGLILANNFGLVDVNWVNLWRLWPLIIIATGLSILALRNLIWRIITIILIILTMGAIAWVAVGGFPVSQSTSSQEIMVQKISDKVKQAEVSVKAGASSLQIDTIDQTEIVKSKLESNIASLTETSIINGETQQVNLSMNVDKNTHWWASDVTSKWSVDITRNLPLKLNVDAGASDTNIDMSQAQLRDINVKTGASSLTLKLGSREDVTVVNIDSGVSSIVLKVPAGSGVQLKLKSGLTTKHLADLSEISKDTYESSGYIQAKNKINITSKVGVSSFTIERY